MATLPSSPPPRLPSPSHSRSSSKYSLDLDALLDDEDSNATMNNTTPRNNKIDTVYTDDIDGPTDFTQNLEYWMTAKLPPLAQQTHEKNFVHAVHNIDDENKPSSIDVFDPLTSTPHTIEHVPLPTNKELQASVEDHDDTPSRVRVGSSTIGTTLKSRLANSDDESAQHDGESETVKNLQEALQKLRLELEEVRIQEQQRLGRVRAEYDGRIRQETAAAETRFETQEREWKRRLNQTLEEHRDQLNQALASKSKEKDTPPDSCSIDEQLIGKNRRIATLEATQEQQQGDLWEAHREITDLKQKLRDSSDTYHAAVQERAVEQATAKAQLDSLRSAYAALEASKRAVNGRLEAIQAELANARLEHANELDVLTAQLEDAVTANATKRGMLRESKDVRNTSTSTAIVDLEAENNRLHTQLDSKDDEIDTLSEELRRIRGQSSTAVDETAQLSAKLNAQKTLNDRAAREIQSLRSGTQILQTRLSDTTNKHAALVADLEAQLAHANAERLEADAEVDELKTRLRVIGEQNERINEAVDARLKQVMKKRDEVWEERMKLVRCEMGLRGKVLLRQWGADEMGEGEPQRYRYKYV